MALDCFDREMIDWTATTAGVSGKLICDIMVECVEARFRAPQAPVRIQCLTDNGSVYAAAETIDLTLALNLELCFTPVESPESNGAAPAFVKTFKREYVRVILKNKELHLREGGADRQRLVEDVDAVAILLDHPRDSPNLTLHTRDPLKRFLLPTFHRPRRRHRHLFR